MSQFMCPCSQLLDIFWILQTAAANNLIFDLKTFRHLLEDFTVRVCNNAVLKCVFTYKIVSKRTNSCFSDH
jgi:hypothetical protein